MGDLSCIWKKHGGKCAACVRWSLCTLQRDPKNQKGAEEMPIGNPSPQTVATRKYEKKAGWVSKSYKMKKEIVEAFADACKKEGVSQAGQLMKMMQEFIEGSQG